MIDGTAVVTRKIVVYDLTRHSALSNKLNLLYKTNYEIFPKKIRRKIKYYIYIYIYIYLFTYKYLIILFSPCKTTPKITFTIAMIYSFIHKYDLILIL
jgi:hypothetical protein